jgi:anaerobic magnesium-protoporphyrin IX monomethyl ester cyclase
LKIALIHPKRNSGYARPPLGLLSLASVCRANGHTAAIIDDNLYQMTDADIINRVKEYPVVGISAMTPDAQEAKRLGQHIKTGYPGKTLLLGGVHASVFPDDDMGVFDYVVAGEGEEVLFDILNIMDDGGIIPKSLTAPGDWCMDSVLPDYRLIDVLSYKPRYPHGDRLPWTAMQVSRGCPYSCTFCSKAVFGSKYRSMNPYNVYRLIAGLVDDYGIRDITFYDDEFTWLQDRTEELCEYLWYEDVTWTCEARVDKVSPRLLKAMKRGNCRMIFYGIESGDQNILDSLDKRTSLDQIEQAIKWTHEAGIQATGYFMLGCPGETKETILKTIDFSHRLLLDHAQFSVCSPLPGSKLYEQWIKDNPPVDWSNFQYLADVHKPMFCDDGLSRQAIENAVASANNVWRKE